MPRLFLAPWRAFDLKLRVDVALKAVRPDRLAREIEPRPSVIGGVKATSLAVLELTAGLLTCRRSRRRGPTAGR